VWFQNWFGDLKKKVTKYTNCSNMENGLSTVRVCVYACVFKTYLITTTNVPTENINWSITATEMMRVSCEAKLNV
jgi:hypothetical protein